MKTRALGLVVSVACACSMLAACGGDSADDLLRSAKGYLEKKDAKAAVVQLKNVLQKTPDSPEARFLLGKTLLESGDAVSAGVELNKALVLKYPAHEVVPALAKALVANREYRKLTEQFGDLVVSEPKSMADLKTSLAIAYASQGEEVKARSALDAAFAAVPEYPPALVMQARFEAAERKFDQAIKSIDRALAKAPSDAGALHFKGELLFFVKSDPAGGIAAFRQALAADPSYIPAHVGVIDGLLAQRDVAGAASQVDELRKAHPHHLQTIYFDAQLAYLKNDHKKAGELIQKVLRVAPSNAQALQLAGAVELRNLSLLRAEDYLSKALQLSPNLTGARRLLAQTYISSGQPEKAITTLEPVLSRGNADSEMLSLAAQAHAQTGDVKRADAYLLQAAKLNPTQTKSRVTLALSRIKDGGVDSALGEVEAIAAADSGPYADLVLLNAYLRKGDFDRALKAVDAIQKKQPDRPYAANLRGRVQLLRKDVADARRSFERAVAIDPAFVPAAANLAALDLADKKPEQAQKRFEGVLAADPKNMQALLAIAGLRAQAGGSTEEVAALLGNAVKAHPNEATPRLALIDHHLAHKDAKRGLAAAQDAVAAMPQSPELLDALGRAQWVVGERNQAINSFNKLVALQPAGSPNAFMRLAVAHAELGATDEARRNLKRAIGIKPDLIVAQRALVELELKAKRPDEALAVARTVRRQRPADPAGYVLEGGVEAWRKNLPAAIEVYREGLKQAASTELAVKLHATLGAANKPADASAFVASWIKEHPKDARFLSYLGEVAIRLREFQTAEGYFRRVDQLLPNSALVLNNLAWILVQLDKPGAVDLAQKADALSPDTPVVLDTLAAAYASDKQFAKAIETAKKAVALAPNAHSLRLMLAKLYIQAGDKAAARSELDMLTKLDTKVAEQPEASRLLKTL